VKRLLALLPLFFCGLAHAQPAAWRANHPNAAGELLLVGSIHVLRGEDYPLPGIIDRLYSQADAIVMELELDTIDSFSMQSALMSAAMIDGGRSLRSLIGAELYELTEVEAAELGVPLAMLEQFEPWFIAITLSSLGILQLGYQADMGLEQNLLARASRDGKDIRGLESLADQVDVFDSLTEPEQRALLEQTLQELETTDAMMEQLIEAWKQGQLEELASELLQDFENFPRLYEKLVADRNSLWADRLTGMVATGGRLLVVVGALHLVGDDSLLDLLAERGFEIERIR
jgi:uncharacterized protein YbaP (TraB family)